MALGAWVLATHCFCFLLLEFSYQLTHSMTTMGFNDRVVNHIRHLGS